MTQPPPEPPERPDASSAEPETAAATGSAGAASPGSASPGSASTGSADVVEAEAVAPGITAGTGAPSPAVPRPDYDEHGVPSLDYVRNKIEGRYAAGLGATELAQDTPEGRSLEQQEADRAAAAKAKLDEIRRSMGR